MIYFKFVIHEKTNSIEKDSIFWVLISKFLSFFIPRANPDYDEQINLVFEWYIEYNDSEKYIEREIGLDEKGNVILKMPYKKNYGFWLDTNLEIDYFFSHFNAKNISKDEFLNKWEELK